MFAANEHAITNFLQRSRDRRQSEYIVASPDLLPLHSAGSSIVSNVTVQTVRPFDASIDAADVMQIALSAERQFSHGITTSAA